MLICFDFSELRSGINLAEGLPKRFFAGAHALSLASAIIPAALPLPLAAQQTLGAGGAGVSVPGLFAGLLGEALTGVQPSETAAAAPTAHLGAEALPQPIRSPLAGLIGASELAPVEGETAAAPEGGDEDAPDTELAGLAGLIQPVVWTPPAASLPAEHAARPLQLSKTDPLAPILPTAGIDAEPELAGAAPILPTSKAEQAATVPAPDKAVADFRAAAPIAAQVAHKAGPAKPETPVDQPAAEHKSNAPRLEVPHTRDAATIADAPKIADAQPTDAAPRAPLIPTIANPAVATQTAATVIASRSGLEPGEAGAPGPVEHDGLIDPAAWNATQARAATAAAPAHAAKPAAPPAQPVPLAQLGVQIGQMAAAGHTRFDISLDPPELGRIRVELDVDAMGQVRTHLIAERAETLDLLQREARQLEKSLADQGLSTGSGSLSFSLKHQGQDSQAQRHFQNPWADSQRQAQNQTLETVKPAAVYRTLTLSALDMRI